MTGVTVNCTQKEHDIVRIHRVMAEMKKRYGDQFSMDCEVRDKSLDVMAGDSARE
jgi:hypothetical protein